MPIVGERVGTVRVIGTGGRFILLETNAVLEPLRDGQTLRCADPDTAGQDGRAAFVRVSREHRPPFVVADVLSGTPRAGDEVRRVEHQDSVTGPIPSNLSLPPSAAASRITP